MRKHITLARTAQELREAYHLTKEFDLLRTSEPIYLRGKASVTGTLSLFIQYQGYNSRGERKQFRESLGLILIPELQPADRERNIATMTLARKQFDTRAAVIFGSPLHGVEPGRKPCPMLRDYIEQLIADSSSKATCDKLRSISIHLAIYSPRDVCLSEVSKEYIRGFVDYLRHQAENLKSTLQAAPLSKNYQLKLYSGLAFIFRQAVMEDLIAVDPCTKLGARDKPSADTNTRVFLEESELVRLCQTPCRNQTVRNAFLFCCFTGLRYSDVGQLAWKDITSEGNKVWLSIVMQKTKERITLPICDNARKFMPVRGEDNDKLFPLLTNMGTNNALASWVKRAGISKKITFHCSRHTFATLALSRGIPMEVVSKFLGHKYITTTQVYAKLIPATLAKESAKLDDINLSI